MINKLVDRVLHDVLLVFVNFYFRSVELFDVKLIIKKIIL